MQVQATRRANKGQEIKLILATCDNGYCFQAQTFTICTNENIIMPLKHPGACFDLFTYRSRCILL
jgi:hypothetical protein